MKKPSLFILIMYGACAVIWSIRAILAVVYQEYDYSVFLFVLNILCAFIWIAGFLKLLDL